MRTALCGLLLCLGLTAGLGAESAAGLRWTPPAGWRSEGPQPMRAATYTVAPAGGDTARGECGVYFFGVGQGGSVEANIERWKGQFTLPSGKPAPSRVATRTIHGLTVTTLDTAGDYSGMGGPMGGGSLASGYRLLGAIVQGPTGNIFLKFAGPASTISANQQKFEQMLASFQPEK